MGSRRGWITAFGMVVTALAGWEPFAAAVDPPRRELSHAVIISIDSLRADHLPMYGYPRMTTPFLARLVEEGRARVFERFTAVAPSCNPSHSTMLTGLYPQQIGLPLCGEDLVFKHADAEDEDQIREVMEYQSLLRRISSITPATSDSEREISSSSSTEGAFVARPRALASSTTSRSIPMRRTTCASGAGPAAGRPDIGTSWSTGTTAPPPLEAIS